MSTFLLRCEKTGYRILHGSDTDVSFVTITRMGPNTFIVVETFIEVDEITDKCITHRVLNRKELDNEFELQYGSPMQYIQKEDYEEFVNQ